MKIKEHIKFAITLGVLPWIPSFILYKHNFHKYALGLLVLFLITAVICFSCEKFALKLKAVLKKIGNFLGKYTAIFVLFLGYIFAVIPTGLLMKLVKRDRLRLKKQKLQSYWIDCKKENTDYEYQF